MHTFVKFCLFGGLFLLSASAASVAKVPLSAASFAHEFEALSQDVEQLNFVPFQMDFANFWRTLDLDALPPKNTIQALQARNKALTPIGACESIQQASLSHFLGLIEQRTVLTATLASQSKKPSYSGLFTELPDGREWYQHWLDSWLLGKIEIADINRIAEQELLTASQLLERAQRAKTGATEQLKKFPADQHHAIVAAFRDREALVSKQLSEVLAIDKPIAPFNIQPSGLPPSFPAPGIYDNTTATFLYHLQNGVMHEMSMDWLFLHEALPGHHLQFAVLQASPLCPSLSFMSTPLVSAEGWAGYIELLGKALGLFQHPESHVYALKWRVLRALRVLIDVGLHHEAWSDERAESLWQQYLPGEEHIMHREIARIKRWPVQVITYVYGKHLIEAALEQQATLNPDMPLSQLRNRVLRLGNQPPIALTYLSEFTNNEE